MIQNKQFMEEVGVLYEELKRYWNRAISTLHKLHSSSTSSSSPASGATSSTTTTSDTTDTSDTTITDKWYDELYKRHNNETETPQRHYHTTIHLKEMLHYIDMLVPIPILRSEDTEKNKEQTGKSSIIDSSSTTDSSIDSSIISSILILATFFHDSIYDPKSTTNEKDSATLFQQFRHEWTTVSGADSATAATGTVSGATVSDGAATASQPPPPPQQQDQQQSTSSSSSTSSSPRSLQPKQSIISDVIQKVITTYILATEKHEVLPIKIPSTTSLTSSSTDEDLSLSSSSLSSTIFMYYQELFLDIDMSVLGKNLPAYFAYANCIRQEYNFVPHDVYCTKRCDILQSFLLSNNNNSNNKNNSIYKTHIMRVALEDKARNNLQQEINLLKQNKIPS